MNASRLWIKTSTVLRVSLQIGIVSAFACWLAHRQGGGDFAWSMRAAQDLLASRDPYDRHFSRFAVPYPLPAALFAFPFAAFGEAVGGSLFFGISSGILTYGLLQEGKVKLLALLSFPYCAALLSAQWSPLIMAVGYFPTLLPVTLAKPNIGLPVAVTHLSKKGVLLCVALFAASVAVYPNWLFRWLSQIGEYDRFIPLFTFPGLVLLVAIPLITKERSARILLAASLVPQRWFYDALPLWLIPKNTKELLFALGTSWIAWLGWILFPHTLEHAALSTTVFLYLPMLGIVLLRWRTTRAMRLLEADKTSD